MKPVIKVGGSLLADPVRLRRLLGELAAGACIVVPGGGPFADAVRDAQVSEGFSDATAHRRALDAMGRMAALFRGIEPRLSVARAPWADEEDGTALVWDPEFLRGGHPDIPESWDVTSDSLALWLATRTGARSCTLVKSVDAPAGLDAAALAGMGLVDAAFPAFARSFRGAIAIRGPSGTVPVPGRRAA